MIAGYARAVNWPKPLGLYLARTGEIRSCRLWLLGDDADGDIHIRPCRRIGLAAIRQWANSALFLWCMHRRYSRLYIWNVDPVTQNTRGTCQVTGPPRTLASPQHAESQYDRAVIQTADGNAKDPGRVRTRARPPVRSGSRSPGSGSGLDRNPARGQREAGTSLAFHREASFRGAHSDRDRRARRDRRTISVARSRRSPAGICLVVMFLQGQNWIRSGG